LAACWDRVGGPCGAVGDRAREHHPPRSRRTAAAASLLAMSRRVLLAAAILAAGALAIAVTGGGAASQPPAGARLDAYVDVARRLYALEADGTVARAAARRLARDPRLAAASRSGRGGRLRAAALRQLFMPARHVVRLSLQRGGRSLVDVGGRFVVAPAARTVPGTGGAVVSASVQDVVGYVKLFHRLTGQAIVVHGRPGHAEARPVSLLHVPMPAAAGAVQLAGRPYAARTFTERGWGGEELRVTVLVPTPLP
jgi:hypothetical protein